MGSSAGWERRSVGFISFVCSWVHLLGGRGARLGSTALSAAGFVGLMGEAVGWVEQREALKWVTCRKKKRETGKTNDFFLAP